jgi:hypothetical protein
MRDRDGKQQLGRQFEVSSGARHDRNRTQDPALQRERPDALLVSPDGFFSSRRVQIASLAAHHRIPAAYPDSIFIAAGGLMS